MNRRFSCWALSCALLLAGSAPAAAQSNAGAPSLQIPPDVRAEGMGRAWTPLSITPYAAWGNVGGLGLLEGVQAGISGMQLVPGLADDVFLDYTTVAVGYAPFGDYGVPVNLSLGYNRTYLTYGTSIRTGEGSPDPIGTFESWEETNGFTLGVGFFDAIGVGVGFKEIEVVLDPDNDDGQGETQAVDYGILARSPYLILDWEAGDPVALGRRSGGHVSLRALGGMSWSNLGTDIALSDNREGDPLPRIRRESLGIEINVLPVSRFLDDPSAFLARVSRDVHVLGFSGAVGRDDSLLEPQVAPEFRDQLTHNEIEGISTYDGWELSVLDLFYYREGSVFDDAGEIKGPTRGWGVSLFGFAGYDEATVPQALDLPEVHKWSLWVCLPLQW